MSTTPETLARCLALMHAHPVTIADAGADLRAGLVAILEVDGIPVARRLEMVGRRVVVIAREVDASLVPAALFPPRPQRRVYV